MHHWGCSVALHTSVCISCLDGLAQPGTSGWAALICLGKTAHFQGAKLSSSWDLPCAVSALSCGVHRSLACAEQEEITKGFPPAGLGPSHTTRAAASQKKTLTVAKIGRAHV